MTSPWTSYIFLFPAVWGSSYYPRLSGMVLHCGGGAHWAHICVFDETFLLGRLLKQTGLNRIGPEAFWSPFSLWVMVGLRTGPKAHCWLWEFYPYNSTLIQNYLLTYQLCYNIICSYMYQTSHIWILYLMNLQYKWFAVLLTIIFDNSLDISRLTRLERWSLGYIL